MTPPDLLAAGPAAGPVEALTAPADSSVHSVPINPASAREKLKRYLAIFRVSLKERMTYRGDFLVGTILRFLPMITTILLWQAIYTGSRKDNLAGFRYREMIA